MVFPLFTVTLSGGVSVTGSDLFSIVEARHFQESGTLLTK